MNSELFIKQLAEKSGLQSLSFNDEGVASFKFDIKYTTHLERSTNDKTVTAYAKIGSLPSLEREKCLIMLLEANLFSPDAAGATFSLDPDTQEIYFYKTFELENLDIDNFFLDLEKFLEAQRLWTIKIETKEYSSTPKALPTKDLFVKKV